VSSDVAVGSRLAYERLREAVTVAERDDRIFEQLDREAGEALKEALEFEADGISRTARALSALAACQIATDRFELAVRAGRIAINSRAALGDALAIAAAEIETEQRAQLELEKRP
jgi:pyruvate/2-oxoglutarate dehydrogenase complex dihydrolipoamide dehydrogenase (E3) component